MYSFNGILMAVEFSLCLFMSKIDIKLGSRIASISIILSIVHLIITVLIKKTFAPAPGIVNMLMYFGILITLTRKTKIREIEIVTDVLTGLANRRGLISLIKTNIRNETSFNLIEINIQNFRKISEVYGHLASEKLLKIISEKINSVVRLKGKAALIDGNGFFIVLDEKYNVNDFLKEVSQKLEEKIELQIDENTSSEIFLNYYIGISNYPKDAQNVDNLIKYSDIAESHAEKDKIHRFCFFDKEMEHKITRQIELEKLIRESLQNDYFYLVYQPQFSLKEKKLRGFETLIRLKTPEGVFVSPAEFVPVAEKSDLSLQIDDYVLKHAMLEQRSTVLQKDITISVNVSAKNIGNSEFTNKIKKLLEVTRFPAKNLELEITEYSLVESIDNAIGNIKKLREMQVQVALDDFGTGYTSLSYLAKMPVNLLKVDKSLVDDIEKDPKSLEFVNAVISMGHLMNCEVISEGVETNSQLSLLLEKNCDFVQGYIWGKPLSYEDACKLVDNSK